MAEQMFKVKNRSASRVGYIIPEDNIRRMFAPGETKTLPGSELVKLSYQPGGKEMMVAFLQISNERMLNALNINPEQEYFMSEKDIVRKLKINAYVVKKAYENINNYKEEEIINNLYELSNLDIDIKINGLDRFKVLENFFLKI